MVKRNSLAYDHDFNKKIFDLIESPQYGVNNSLIPRTPKAMLDIANRMIHDMEHNGVRKYYGLPSLGYITSIIQRKDVPEDKYKDHKNSQYNNFEYDILFKNTMTGEYFACVQGIHYVEDIKQNPSFKNEGTYVNFNEITKTITNIGNLKMDFLEDEQHLYKNKILPDGLKSSINISLNEHITNCANYRSSYLMTPTKEALETTAARQVRFDVTSKNMPMFLNDYNELAKQSDMLNAAYQQQEAEKVSQQSSAVFAMPKEVFEKTLEANTGFAVTGDAKQLSFREKLAAYGIQCENTLRDLMSTPLDFTKSLGDFVQKSAAFAAVRTGVNAMVHGISDGMYSVMVSLKNIWKNASEDRELKLGNHHKEMKKFVDTLDRMFEEQRRQYAERGQQEDMRGVANVRVENVEARSSRPAPSLVEEPAPVNAMA